MSDYEKEHLPILVVKALLWRRVSKTISEAADTTILIRERERERERERNMTKNDHDDGGDEEEGQNHNSSNNNEMEDDKKDSDSSPSQEKETATSSGTLAGSTTTNNASKDKTGDDGAAAAKDGASSSRRNKNLPGLLVAFMGMIIIMIAVVLAVTLRNQKSPGDGSMLVDHGHNLDDGSSDPSTLPGDGGVDDVGGGAEVDLGDVRQQVMDYIIFHGVSKRWNFADPESPQSRSLDFITYIDEFYGPSKLISMTSGGGIDVGGGGDSQVATTRSGDLSSPSPEGYQLITRYVLVVFYYATSGPNNWEWDINFMSPKEHICEWFTNSNRYGHEGVNCQVDTEMTEEIQSLRFGASIRCSCCCCFCCCCCCCCCHFCC